MTVPLERALSKLGLATRAEARLLIREGRVRVNGRLASNPLAPVVPERIAIDIDGRQVVAQRHVVIALHKPPGVVTTKRDPRGRTTIYDLLRDCPYRVVPAGRLDYATSGLLLLSNDTRFTDWLTDPRNEVPRIYLVTARGRVSDEQAQRLVGGIRSGDELLRARRVTLRKVSNRESHLVVELVEGKNRELRRLLQAIGHPVTRLRRVQFGQLTLGTLAPGEWRALNAAELRDAFPGAKFTGNALLSRGGHR